MRRRDPDPGWASIPSLGAGSGRRTEVAQHAACSSARHRGRHCARSSASAFSASRFDARTRLYVANASDSVPIATSALQPPQKKKLWIGETDARALTYLLQARHRARPRRGRRRAGGGSGRPCAPKNASEPLAAAVTANALQTNAPERGGSSHHHGKRSWKETPAYPVLTGTSRHAPSWRSENQLF